MKKILCTFLGCAFLISASAQIEINHIGRYTDGRTGALEIVAYDSFSNKLFITNAITDSIDFVDVSNPALPARVGGVNILPYGSSVTSVVSLNNGFGAAAIVANTKTDSGKVIFFNTSGTVVKELTVGALPDMITVTPDFKKLLVACEGEPNDDYAIDPEGAIGIIDLTPGVSALNQSHVTLLTFEDAPTTISGSVNKPGVPWSQDLEPEYIAVSEDSKTAAVTCQEANVLVFVNLDTKTITAYKGLGFKDHSIDGQGFDASDRDGKIDIKTHPVKGIYMPDAIASFSKSGKNYFVTANEGDGRDYSGYSSETRVKDLTLDKTVFTDTTLQLNENLSRLKTLTADLIGDTDGDGKVDELYSYGARSFSIWDNTGTQVYDSKDDFEQYIAAHHAPFFNCNEGLADEFDGRSDDKGPEPEAVAVGKIGDAVYAFIGLERQSGIFVYDITDPLAPVMDTFLHTYKGDTVSIDVAPEGIIYSPKERNALNKNLLIVSHKVSGTVSIYEIQDKSSSVGGVVINNSQVTLYPNPVDDYLNIKLPASLKDVQIEVLNILGQQVLVTNISQLSQTYNLNIGSINSGIYFVRISSPELSKSIKVKFVKK